jgi:ketopantoate reductase
MCSAQAGEHRSAGLALDLERGNRLELPWLGGKVVELGRKLGVPTPTILLSHRPKRGTVGR